MIEFQNVKNRAVSRCENDLSYFNRFVMTRLRQDETYYTEKVENIVPCNKKLKKDIMEWWNEFIPHCTGLVNYDMFDVYNKFEADKSRLKYYVPDSFFYSIVDEYYSNPQRSVPWDDKNMYDLLFHDINRPETLFRRIGGCYFDKDNNRISLDDVLEMCAGYDEVVLKASVSSYGGHGVRFWTNRYGNSIQDLKALLDDRHAFYPPSSARSRFEIIGQKPITQHQVLSDICKTSVNTIRVMTMMSNNDAIALSSILRMGVKGSRVDNASSGGIFCGIAHGGVLKNVAYNTKAKRFLKHPDKTEFAGVKVPGFDKVLELAKRLQRRFNSVSRLISWDFAIDENGEPLLIEMNISFGEIDFHQICNGPIFGDRLPSVLLDLLEHSYTLRRLL